MYILPPSISKKIEGYRWQSFTPPAAGKSRRFRGLICHRRSQAFLKTKSQKRKIIFSTYQSGKVLARGVKKAKVAFDLRIMDEAHRTVGPESRSFSHLLYDKNVRIKRRLFMTATERIVRGAYGHVGDYN